MQVAGTLVPLLKFYFHEEVRKAAVSGNKLFVCSLLPVNMYYWAMIVLSFYSFPCVLIFYIFYLHFSAMPELLRSAKLAIEKGQSQGRDASYLKFLTDTIIPALVEALHKVTMVPIHPFLVFLI